MGVVLGAAFFVAAAAACGLVALATTFLTVLAASFFFGLTPLPRVFFLVGLLFVGAFFLGEGAAFLLGEVCLCLLALGADFLGLVFLFALFCVLLETLPLILLLFVGAFLALDVLRLERLRRPLLAITLLY